MADVYDCQSCGACCFSPWTGDGYVRLYNLDLGRLGGRFPAVYQEQGYGEPPEVIPKLGTRIDEHGGRVCVAFEGRGGARCACGIYPSRPEPCRRFEAGGRLCREARQRLGLPVVNGEART